MSQIFRPSTNSIFRVSIAAVALIAGGAGYALMGINRAPYVTRAKIPFDQPVPFSHKHHVAGLGIDCRYCHSTVERTAFAGMPATETCMSCHSQIWTNSPLLEPVRQSYETETPLKWNLVNKVPEFVYFNHSIHINRGINCNQCHGPVQEMHITWKGNSFQMQWCLECHRAPEKYIYNDDTAPGMTPRQQVFNLYWKMQRGEHLTDREVHLERGESTRSEDKADIEAGRELVKKYGIRTQELADCSICHR